jgi:integrase
LTAHENSGKFLGNRRTPKLVAQMSLTDTQIRTAKASAKARKLRDGRGLFLEIPPSGSRRWRFRYFFGGIEKQISLGLYPEVSLKDARVLRDEARSLVARGINPSVARKAAALTQRNEGNDSFELIAREWLVNKSEEWVPSHTQRTIRCLERDIFPKLGPLPVKVITAERLLAPLIDIQKRKTRDGQPVRETAHRALQTCREILNYAIYTSRLRDNPATHLKGALKAKQSKNFAAAITSKDLASILRAMSDYRGEPQTRAALQLMPLVFVRPGDLRYAKWEDINFISAEWTFTPSKTAKTTKLRLIVPLAVQAIKILRRLKLSTGDSPFVFPSARTKTRPMSDNTVLAAMRRLGISREDATGHGFRASARTILAEVLQYPCQIIEIQLAHAKPDANGSAYNRTTFLPERREMMQKWADYLDKLKETS